MNFFKNSLILFFSTIIGLVFVEIICTIFFEQSKSESWRIQDDNGLYINKRSGFSQHEFIGKTKKLKLGIILESMEIELYLMIFTKIMKKKY